LDYINVDKNQFDYIDNMICKPNKDIYDLIEDKYEIMIKFILFDDSFVIYLSHIINPKWINMC
jgi:hypothetical protein